MSKRFHTKEYYEIETNQNLDNRVQMGRGSDAKENKPDWATMRPDCVSACIDHLTYLGRQMDEQTDETTE